MSGKIEHADRPEGGTIFTIHLPCTEKAACGDKAKELP
jgi:signal transduction histidine kinase